MIVFLAGPIEHWWGDNWDTPEHWRYAKWRDAMSVKLVQAGHLVYHPHNAFKGEWDGNDGDHFGQVVNDAALLASDVIVNMCPPDVPSEGTDDEMATCERHGKRVVFAAPPVRDDYWDTALMLAAEIVADV